MFYIFFILKTYLRLHISVQRYKKLRNKQQSFSCIVAVHIQWSKYFFLFLIKLYRKFKIHKNDTVRICIERGVFRTYTEKLNFRNLNTDEINITYIYNGITCIRTLYISKRYVHSRTGKSKIKMTIQSTLHINQVITI